MNNPPRHRSSTKGSSTLEDTSNSTESSSQTVITRHIHAPYAGISNHDYNLEKRRLQLELLKIQTDVVKQGKRLCLLFDGRDAAGKGSTIHRFAERLMPMHTRVVNLGIPNTQESNHWFKRYQQHLPKPGEWVMFDRSWYNRALIEPTMGYCSQQQYEDFLLNVLEWEHQLIESGMDLIKFYLSVDIETQLIRFHQRLSDPLTFWKLSENDFKARNKWQTFTKFKEQMFKHTSSPKSPWVVVRSNSKREARLTCMLHVVRCFGKGHFKPLTREIVPSSYGITLNGIPFKNLTIQQYQLLKAMAKSAHPAVDITQKQKNLH